MHDLTDEQTELLDKFIAGPHNLADWQYQVLVDAGLVERGPTLHRLTRRGVQVANARTAGAGLIVSGPAGVGRTFGRALQRRRGGRR